jgi:5'-3' exonuclease
MFFDDEDSVLLVDFNNLLFRTLYVREVYIQSDIPDFKLWRFLVYDSIYAVIKKFNVSEVILAVDDKVSWRRSYFPRYKESRKKQRDKSDIDFNIVFSVINKFIRELKHSMPFKIIKVRSGEADDVIGTLALELGNCIISSNDEDFHQLVDIKDNRLWNPSRQEFSEFPINIHTKKDPIMCKSAKEFLEYKILMGQSKDDIFNILTPNDWGLTPETEGKRKPGFGPKKAQKIIESGKIRQFLEDNNLEDHWKRNSVLIDFQRIPNVIKNRVIDGYNNHTYPPPDNIYKFFKEFQMRYFLENFEFVEQKLMRLY